MTRKVDFSEPGLLECTPVCTLFKGVVFFGPSYCGRQVDSPPTTPLKHQTLPCQEDAAEPTNPSRRSLPLSTLIQKFHTILTEIMADEFNFSRPEIKNYKAEADADLIPIPGHLELHGRCRGGVLLSTCFCAIFVADLIVGMEELELHCRRRGRYNFWKIKIATISVRMVRIRAEKGTQTQTFGSRYPPVGWGVFHVKGWGPRSSACPLETRETKLFFGRDIPGFCRDIPEAPEKFEK